MSSYFFRSIIGLALAATPLISQAADDSRITSVTMDTQSNSTADATADYALTMVTSATISSGERITFLIIGENGGDPAASGFDFSSTTFASHNIVGAGAVGSTAAFYSVT